MKGFALGLALKQRRKATRKLLINLSIINDLIRHWLLLLSAQMFSSSCSESGDDLGVDDIIRRTAEKPKTKKKFRTHGAKKAVDMSTSLLDLVDDGKCYLQFH